MNTRRGLIKRPKLLKELRNVIREDATRSGDWKRVKMALDDTPVGEREGVVMFEQARDQTITAIAVLGYREDLGSVPKVRIVPRLDLRLHEPNPPHPGQSVWRDGVLEVSSRLTEVRVAAKASGAAEVEVQVVGSGKLAEDVRLSLRASTRMSPGASIVMDGERTDPDVADYDWSEGADTWTSPLCVLLEGWTDADVRRDGDPAFRDLIAGKETNLALASVNAWHADLSDSQDPVRLTGEDLYDADDPDVLCHLEKVTNPIEFRSRLRKTKLSPFSLSPLFGIATAVAQDRGKVAMALVTTPDGLPCGVASVMRSVAVKELGEGRAHVAYCATVMSTCLDDTRNELWSKASSFMLRSQVEQDLSALAENLSGFAKSVRIDVVGMGVDKGDGTLPSLDDGIGAGADSFYEFGEEYVEEGEIVLRSMPAEAIERMRM